jgi:radical SAM superfamily enzyme YgiQ (UPF0313 family)
MATIVLTTLNAKFIHAAFGLRYLMANLGSLRSEAKIIEFDINQRPMDIVEGILAEEPRIVGLGVYIWNAALSLEIVSALKRIAPGVMIVLGGPEVSYEIEAQAIASVADYVVTGEADLKFAELCSQLLGGTPPANKIIPSELPELGQLLLPYEFYDERDIAHRVIYVEASRGCPFTCEFCLSSLDVPVRQFPLARFLSELDRLLQRGVKQFKFVDRTFNLNLSVSQSILQFFLERLRPGVFLHFEMIPDRLPDGLRALIQNFPPGALQFEIGIQTFNEEVANRIKRRQNYRKVEENLRFLRQETRVHIHADLIVGLPGESVESFGRGFDRLVALGPQEIQVGILKRLRGTPIVRHDADWAMVYSEHAPYEILQNKLIDFASMQRMRRFARYWDLVANSGNFIETTALLWKNSDSPFDSFVGLGEWLYAKLGRCHGIGLLHLAEMFFEFLTEVIGHDRSEVALAFWRDYSRSGRRTEVPAFLRDLVPVDHSPRRQMSTSAAPKRQARHWLPDPTEPGIV